MLCWRAALSLIRNRGDGTETLLGLPALVTLALVGSSSIKITSGGWPRLVERLGRYDRSP